MSRPSWDAYFEGIAQSVAQRASCPRAKVGVVLVSDQHRILATGYNGAAPGERDCLIAGCDMADGHCQRALHAEVNAIAFAARAGVRIEGATLYLWMQREGGEPMTIPDAICRECAKVVIAAGVMLPRKAHQ